MIINQQRGTALISALLITAISVLLATATLLSLRSLIHQTDLTINNDQMYQYLIGVNDWAEMTLLTTKNIKQTKSLNIVIGNTQVTGKILAQQGLFNLNSLEQPQNEINFSRLLQNVVPHMSPQRADNLAKAVNAWITSGAANDDLYLALSPPYRPANRWFVVPSELRAVIGFDATTYEQLLPFITTLPTTQNLIDINYASTPILMTLNDKITLAQAQALHACRQKQVFFSSTVDFMTQCVPNHDIVTNNITTDENYYIVIATAEQGIQQLRLVTLVQRYQDASHQDNIKIIWQQLE